MNVELTPRPARASDPLSVPPAEAADWSSPAGGTVPAAAGARAAGALLVAGQDAVRAEMFVEALRLASAATEQVAFAQTASDDTAGTAADFDGGAAFVAVDGLAPGAERGDPVAIAAMQALIDPAPALTAAEPVARAAGFERAALGPATWGPTPAVARSGGNAAVLQPAASVAPSGAARAAFSAVDEQLGPAAAGPAKSSDREPAQARSEGRPTGGGAAQAADGAAVLAGMNPGAEGGRRDAPLRLPNGSPDGWRQPLAEALGERIQVEAGRGAERAVIRLDPPMMGRVEIVIRHEAGNLQVQLTATHGEVLRQLNGMAEGLRQELAARQYTAVDIQVADGLRDSGGRQRQGSDDGREGQENPGRGLAGEADGEASPVFTLARGQE